MNNDIQEIVNDNLSLKRAYQHCKNEIDKLQRQKELQRSEIAELEHQNDQYMTKYTEICNKYKKLQATTQSNSNSFTSQIQELKLLIEQKEQDLENFQLKIIPSLDQDMLRVKLIAQMQGPYQQAIDSKDRQISKLKDQIHRIKRDKQMIQFSSQSTEKILKDQLSQIKRFYQSENQRLTKQLAHIACKRAKRSYDNQIINGYRRQIQELQIALQYQKNNEQSLRREISEYKIEREKLLNDIEAINMKKAVEINRNGSQEQVISLKYERQRLEDENNNLTRQLEKIRRSLKNIEDQKNTLKKQLEKELHQSRQQADKKRETMREQIMDYKQEIRRLKDIKNRHQQDCLTLSKKYNEINQKYQSILQENRSLQIKYDSLHESRYSSQFNSTQRQRLEQEIRHKIEKDIRVQVERQYKIKYEEHKHIYHHHDKQDDNKSEQGKRHDSPTKQEEMEALKKEQEKVATLKIRIDKLEKKLAYANHKIMELLQEKARWKNQNNDHYQQDDQQPQKWNPPQSNRTNIFLEHRDCSFVPMCPPIVWEGIPSRGSYL